MSPANPAILVLAASRRGAGDSVARLQGKSHKCLVDLAGMAMIERVLRALFDSGRCAIAYVSIESETVLREVPAVAEWLDRGKVVVVESKGNLADSVIAAIACIDTPLPMIITTGDNALHTPELVRDYVDMFMAAKGDVSVAFTHEDDVVAEFPQSGLAFHRLKDGGFSSCNLYGLRNRRAVDTVRVFEGGGQFGKRHWRILKAFGIVPFLLYKLKATTCQGLMDRIGHNLGVSVDSHMLPYSYAPIDVDNPFSFALTEKALLARRDAP